MNRRLAVKFALALALTGLSFAFGSQPSEAYQICVMACTNPPPGTCSSIRCHCDAAGGALKKCVECSDNDYTCPGYCYWDQYGVYHCL
jgi:hypothetical protein